MGKEGKREENSTKQKSQDPLSKEMRQKFWCPNRKPETEED